MIRRLVAVVLLGAVGLVAAGSAIAQPASFALSTCPGCGGPGSTPPFIPVVGFSAPGGTVPHAGTAITMTIVDGLGVPLVGYPVRLNFGACSDLRLCSMVPVGSPEVIGCAVGGQGTVFNFTGPGGVVTFQLVGAGMNNGTPALPVPPAPAGCAILEVGPVGAPDFILPETAVVFDQDGGVVPFAAGSNGVSPVDLARFVGDLFSPGYEPRSDYSALNGCNGPTDCGVINVLDLAAFATSVLFAPAPNSFGGCSANAIETISGYCP